MSNQQLAAARRAFNRFSGYKPVKTGNLIAPRRESDGTVGEGVEIHEATSEGEIERQLIDAIEAMG